MKVQVLIERGTDGSFDANMEFVDKVPSGLLGQGKTVSEAIADFRNSYAEIRGFYAGEGKNARTWNSSSNTTSPLSCNIMPTPSRWRGWNASRGPIRGN